MAEAKRQLFGRVGIDLLAGPTEIVVIADESAEPELVAADLLGQAEHGPTSPAILITTSRAFGETALEAVDELLQHWPTREVAGEAWRRHGSVAVVADRREAIALSDGSPRSTLRSRWANQSSRVPGRSPQLRLLVSR